MLWLLIILSIVFILFTIEPKNEKKPSSGVSVELSLKEAIRLGLNRAKSWNKNAYLARVTSVDENMGGTRGATGKRYRWTLTFETTSTDQQLFVVISKGKISATHKGYGSIYGKLNLDSIKLDSPDYLKIAKEKYDLQKGVDWATGYHFTLQNDNGKPTVAVLGNDKNMLFTRISIDSRNGEILDASHKVPVGGGVIQVHLGSDKPVIIKKGLAVMGLSIHNNQIAVWGDNKPRVFNLSVQPFWGYSKNGGESWHDSAIDKAILKAWVNTDNELYAANEVGLWRIETSSNKMIRILTTGNKIEKINYTTNNNIVILSNNKIYKTLDNGGKWNAIIQPEAEKIYSIQISEGGTVILLTSNGEVYQESGDKWIKRKLLHGVETPSYMELIEDNLVLLSGTTLWSQNIKDNSWNKIQTNHNFNYLIKKGDNLFGISEDRIIYLINLGGVANEWKAERLFEVKEGIITDVELTQNDLFIATVPDYYWETMH